MKAPNTALEVASHLIRLAQHADAQEPVFLTNLHVQKLLFYAQAWSLAERSTPLFGDKIEAWAQGPAVYAVWKQFESFGKRPIDPDAVPPSSLSQADQAFLRTVWEAYKMYNAPTLRDMTHEEPAWRHARKDLAPDDRSTRELPLDELGQTFRHKLDFARQRLQSRRAEVEKRARANMLKRPA